MSDVKVVRIFPKVVLCLRTFFCYKLNKNLGDQLSPTRPNRVLKFHILWHFVFFAVKPFGNFCFWDKMLIELYTKSIYITKFIFLFSQGPNVSLLPHVPFLRSNLVCNEWKSFLVKTSLTKKQVCWCTFLHQNGFVELLPY